jgi:fructose-1,6-bisphosphatase I
MASTLQTHLEVWANGDTGRVDVAGTVATIAGVAVRLSEVIACGPLVGQAAAILGTNTDGDAQRELDLRADEMFLTALREAPVAVLASEERAGPVALRGDASLAVAIDPVDGSSNIDTNLAIGTIFSVLPTRGGDDPTAVFLQPGERQLASGFVIYGPQTALVLTLRKGTHIFTLDRRTGHFVLTRPAVKIPTGKREYAINASNYRHWETPVRTFVDDCAAGADGPRAADFNMRWNACVVTEAFRILGRGGVFLYPRDARPAYRNGRLRLVYEANPLALIVEEAGGAATDGQLRILGLVPQALHQRVPLVFGCRDAVERVAAYHSGKLPAGERSPLFYRRGLFRL